MGSLNERIAADAHTSADLIAQFNELTGLRERLRKAQLSVAPSGADLPLSYPAAGGVSCCTTNI
jgi:hypothetical protein